MYGECRCRQIVVIVDETSPTLTDVDAVPDHVGDAPITSIGASVVPQGPEGKIGTIFDQYQPFSNQQVKRITKEKG